MVESKTALLLEPYADGSGDTGVPDMDPVLYRRSWSRPTGWGWTWRRMPSGTAGVRLALDAYEAAQQANGGRRGRRHRVEHIEVGNPTDIPRFGKLGVTASMQPLHAAPGADPRYDTVDAARRRRARALRAFAWRSVLETGAHLAFGSDWPIVAPDVRLGMHAALTRTSRAGEPAGGWQPQQGITLAQALDAYTRGAAYAEAQDDVKGTLRAGMLADMAVFRQDLFRLPPDEIRSVEVALTVVDGRVVHRAM